MDQEQIEKLIKYCPTCGRVLEPLPLVWGWVCSDHGEIIVNETNTDSEVVIVMLTFETFVR